MRQAPCSAAFIVAKSRPISSTRPALGASSAAQQVQQRALARTRGADDGQRLAGLDLQVDAAQHLHVQCIGAAALLEALVQVAAGEYGLIHSAAPRPG